jgi:hypothetical protein
MKRKWVVHAIGLVCVFGMFIGCEPNADNVVPVKNEEIQTLISSAKMEKASEDSIEMRSEGTSENTSGEMSEKIGRYEKSDSVSKIELEFSEIDLGLISSDSNSIKEVRIMNQGTAPLIISKVTTSCGCTQGKMKEDTIFPGKEGILEITVDPNRINGFRSRKVLTIASNDPNQSIIQLPVSARLNGGVELSEKEFNFENIKGEDVIEKKIRITQTESESVQLKNISLSSGTPEQITLRIVEIPRSEWKNPDLLEQDLVMSISAGLPGGTHKYSAELNWERAKNPIQTIPIVLNVIGPYQFTPDAITLRKVTPGQKIDGVMHLTYTIPVEVKSLSMDNESIEITHRAGEDPNTVAFDFRIAEPQENRLQKGDLTVVLSVEGEEVKHIIRAIGLMERVPTSN